MDHLAERATEGEWTSEFDSAVDPDTEWTAANIQEALPGLLTPMTWTLSRPLLEYAFARPAERIGAHVAPRDPYVALFYGRPFLNLTALREGATRVPFSSPDAIDEHYLGRVREPGAKPWSPTLRQRLAYLPVLPRMGFLMLNSGKELEQVEERVRRSETEDGARDQERLSARELAAAIDASADLGREVASIHIGVSGGASSAFGALGRLTLDWLDDFVGSLQAVLCSGLAEVESARPGMALWDLSRFALRSPEVDAALNLSDASAALAGLRTSPTDEAHGFLAAYEAFVRRFGHRGVMEGELSTHSWEEDPNTVFAMLRNLRRTGNDANPYLIQGRQRDAREKATADALARLGAARRLVFGRVLALAQRYVSTRERTKSLLVKGSNGSRRLLRALGRRFSEGGILNLPDDVFYLTWGEARALAVGEGPADAKERVARRQAEAERNRGVALPETFRGRPVPAGASAQERFLTLKGIPVAPGRASGPARVVLDPRKDATIAPGEVLVAPVTDVGWTPLFLTAAAVVVDIGGPLSHGATVARELGLPAVVNVKHGTRLIRTGQRITVDGATGVVTIEED